MYRLLLSSLMLGVMLFSQAAFAAPSVGPHDGSHDFDFALGTWTTHIHALRRGTWLAYTGTATVHAIWRAGADLEHIDATAPGRHLQGMTLRLYNADSGQWSLYWASSSDGQLAQPMSGRFAGGRGVFYDQESIGGHMAFVRNEYFAITPRSYRFAQAVSNDGGRTWSENFTAALTRRS